MGDRRRERGYLSPLERHLSPVGLLPHSPTCVGEYEKIRSHVSRAVAREHLRAARRHASDRCARIYISLFRIEKTLGTSKRALPIAKSQFTRDLLSISLSRVRALARNSSFTATLCVTATNHSRVLLRVCTYIHYIYIYMYRYITNSSRVFLSYHVVNLGDVKSVRRARKTCPSVDIFILDEERAQFPR